MKKPLSQKTIERMYNDFELKEETINLLHDYFLSFSNLYGIISIRDAWAVFMNYEKLNSILNSDKKYDIFYQERAVWIQSINNEIAKIGFVDNFDEKDVPIKDLYEKN